MESFDAKPPAMQPTVLSSGHDNKMVRIDAQLESTGVMNQMLVGDRPDEEFVGRTMRIADLVVSSPLSIAATPDRTSPFMATVIALDNLVQKLLQRISHMTIMTLGHDRTAIRRFVPL